MTYKALPLLRPVGYDGAAPSGSVRRLCYLAASAGQKYIGQLVKLTGTSDAVAKYPGVSVMAVGDGGFTYGVITGFEYDGDREKTGRKYLNANEAAYVRVEADPDAVFEAMADDALVAADVGLNVDIINVAAALNDMLGFPGVKLDSSTKATTATLPLTLLGLKDVPDNVATDTDAAWLVKMNNHQSRSNTGI